MRIQGRPKSKNVIDLRGKGNPMDFSKMPELFMALSEAGYLDPEDRVQPVSPDEKRRTKAKLNMAALRKAIQAMEGKKK